MCSCMGRLGNHFGLDAVVDSCCRLHDDMLLLTICNHVQARVCIDWYDGSVASADRFKYRRFRLRGNSGRSPAQPSTRSSDHHRELRFMGNGLPLGYCRIVDVFSSPHHSPFAPMGGHCVGCPTVRTPWPGKFRHHAARKSGQTNISTD